MLRAVAQLVEQRINKLCKKFIQQYILHKMLREPRVGGSNPSRPTKIKIRGAVMANKFTDFLKKLKPKKRISEKERLIAEAVKIKNSLNDTIRASEYLNAKKDAETEQMRLDYQKYFESINKDCDMSGKMQYCAYCKYNKDGACIAEQKTRMEETLCAKAFKEYYQELLHEKAKNFVFTTKA